MQIILALMGFTAGVMLWSRLVQFTLAIASAVTHVDFVNVLKAPTESQLRKFLIAGLCSSLAWIACFAAAVWYCIDESGSARGWVFFWSGFSLGPLPAYFLTLRAVRRMRERGQLSGNT